MRCFIGITPSRELRERLATFQRRLAAVTAGVKWVEVDNLHLTLRFLGEIDDALVSALSASMSRQLAECQAFVVRVEGCGAFPSDRRARVLWAGIMPGDQSRLQRLAARVDDACADSGAGRDGRFSPHITVGRVREPAPNPALSRELSAGSGELFGELTVDHVHLFASNLTQRGPIYRVVARFDLKSI